MDGTRHMDAEAELLLCASRTTIGTEKARRIRAIVEQGPNWNRLIATALTHGVMPLLYRSLNSIASDAVPEAIISRLRDHYQINSRNNLLMTGEMLRLLALFEADGIDAIPFKGPALATLAYGDLSLRQFVDIDVLTRKRDVLQARDILQAQGYVPRGQRTSPRALREVLDSHHQMGFQHPETGMVFELQWGFAPKYFRFYPDMERLFTDGERLSVAGKQVRSLPTEDYLLLLCVHGSKHGWERLAWVCDVAEFIDAHPSLDWNRVLSAADELGTRRMLLLGMILARDLLDLNLPEPISPYVDVDPIVMSLKRDVTRRLVASPVRALGVTGMAVFQLRSMDRMQDKALYCMSRFFNHRLVRNRLLHRVSQGVPRLSPIRALQTSLRRERHP